MSLQPTFCPLPGCSSSTEEGFSCIRKGFFHRACDGRRIQRFQCQSCGRKFSSQTFRFTYRLRKPQLRLQLYRLLTSKVTMRQAARIMGCSRHTVERLHRRMGAVCQDFHQLRLRHFGTNIAGSFQLDELETFETDRLLRPVTVPVLIEKHSYFVIHIAVAPMGPRGNLRPAAKRRRQREFARFGKRVNGSRRAVKETLNVLQEALHPDQLLDIQTDRKSSYRRLVHELFPDRLGTHVRESSRRRRDYSNILFPINHTLAMMRDGVSRLVRRSWGASKCRHRLADHLAIWTVYRNYTRGITVLAPETTPGMALGVSQKVYQGTEILSWRWPLRMG